MLHYYSRWWHEDSYGTHDDAVVRFLLTAAAIGMLCTMTASISGAEVGCQGEVGSASAMADAGCDMHEKYKETSLGGLAVNVIEC